MLTARHLKTGGHWTVDSLWSPLNLEHRLPRNLVLVIYLTAASGRSPSCRIPLTVIKSSIPCQKMQDPIFLDKNCGSVYSREVRKLYDKSLINNRGACGKQAESRLYRLDPYT